MIENNIIEKIYCDGACSGNPGNSGTGVVLFYQNKKVELYYGGFVEQGTNNIAELNGIYKALLFVKLDKNSNQIKILADSKYAIDCISKWSFSWSANGWKKKGGEIKNLELIQAIFKLYLAFKHRVVFEHVKGHSGDFGNELADVMARKAIKMGNYRFERYDYNSLESVLKEKY